MVAAVDAMVAKELGPLARRRKDGSPVPPAFQPCAMRGLTVENRMVLSPMCQYSAQDGLPNDWHLMHYGSRAIGGQGKIWIRVFPHKPISAKPAETRMGTGKGEPEFWAAVIKPGTILFELGGVTEDKAKLAFKRIAHKLPIKVKMVKRLPTT